MSVYTNTSVPKNSMSGEKVKMKLVGEPPEVNVAGRLLIVP